MTSFLDRLQKDAHKSEMEPSNTSAAFFMFLSVAQTLVMVAVAWLLPWRFQYAAWMGLGSHWIGFIISVIIHSDKWFDVTEDIAYYGMFIWAYMSIEGEASSRQQLVFLLAFIWVTRLLGFLGFRVIMRGSDWRFDKLISNHAYNLFGWTSGGTWCFLNGFCLWWIISISGEQAPLGWLDYLGVLVFVLGFLAENVSDYQKYQFNAKHASGKNKKWISTGLWAYSRHPNYCGEISLWLGLSLICMGGADASMTSIGLCLVSPIWSGFFLFFTSLMLLEKRGDTKWGQVQAYAAYKAKTPVLFPIMS